MAAGLFQESYVVACGVQQVVQNLSAPLQHIHLETQIVTIRPNINPDYRFELIDEHGRSYNVHHIIFATQGNQAASMLKGYSDALKEQANQSYQDWKLTNEPLLAQLELQMNMLQKFEYDTALVINHTDTRLLPTDTFNWKALNLAIVDKTVDPGDSDLIVPYPHDTTMATHILNMTHASVSKIEGNALYMQTTNPCVSVDPKKILSVAWFERATVTLDSKKALQQLFTTNSELGPCQGKNGIWFVGSYCWKGIPLLEGCVASAEHVVTKGIASAENITINVPWH
jgi:predicted NAD/FAD-binding protein